MCGERRAERYGAAGSLQPPPPSLARRCGERVELPCSLRKSREPRLPLEAASTPEQQALGVARAGCDCCCLSSWARVPRPRAAEGRLTTCRSSRPMIPGAASAARGIVAWVGPGCDYFVAETPMGYAVLEWYGGARPRKGDLVVGAFEKFGFT